jgi:peroxiredoxin
MMKNILTTLTPVLLTALFVLCSCDSGDPSFRVQGTITGAVGKTLFLEHQGLTSIEAIDSVVLDESGGYKMKGAAPEYPEFYRLRLEQQIIPFSVDSIETITINSDAQSFATGYSVEGSAAAKKIKGVWLAQLDANVAMSNLVQRYDAGQLSYEDFAHERDSIMESYKVGAQEVIFEDPKSPVAYFALFQQVDGNLIFNIYDKKDSRVFATVANVYDAFYPESPRRDHLYNLALRSLAVVRQLESARQQPDAEVIPSEKVREVGYIDIALADVDGKEVRLSDIADGHVVILSFTVMDADWNGAYQSQLEHLYNQFESKGLRIYQVDLDQDAYVWRNRVSSLPWYNVRDPEGVYSSLIGLYNVTSLPALFLIDRQGEIVMRVTSLAELQSKIADLL